MTTIYGEGYVADMMKDELPPLPESGYDVWDDYYDGITLSANGPRDRYEGLKLWDEEQLRSYGEACMKAGMELAAVIAEDTICAEYEGVDCYGDKAAAAIRAAILSQHEQSKEG